MKRFYILSIISIQLFCSYSSAFAENQMIIIGGGGDPAGSTTIFDSPISVLGNSLQNAPSWKYAVSFDGGHATTEEILKSKFPKASNTSFTADSYKKLIENYKAKINSGELKSGDQLIIILDTHGAINEGQQISHMVASSDGRGASDLNNLKDAALVNVDDLQSLVNLASAKGIKLGLVDLSCHSGSTQNLKVPNVCIISATGPVHYSYIGEGTFGNYFLENLTSGTSLEEAFLKARLASTDSGFPMISTPQSDQVISQIYKDITPFLYSNNPKTDKLTDYLIKASTNVGSCQKELMFSDLISKIDRLQAATGNAAIQTQKIKALLNEYKVNQDKISAGMKALGAGEIFESETFEDHMTFGKTVEDFSMTVTKRQLLYYRPDDTIGGLMEQQKSAKSQIDKMKAQLGINVWNKIKVRQAEVVAKYPNLGNFETDAANLVHQIKETGTIANQIALEEKKLYQFLYQSQPSQANDPCRQIKF